MKGDPVTNSKAIIGELVLRKLFFSIVLSLYSRGNRECLSLLCVDTRVRKIAIIDFQLRHVCLSVRPSVRIEQLGFHWINVHEISYSSIFRKSVHKIQVSLKSDKNDAFVT